MFEPLDCGHEARKTVLPWRSRLKGNQQTLTILITGASTGLGLSIAKELMRTRHRLILTARLESLSRFASEGIFENPKVLLRVLDVLSASDRQKLFQEFNDDNGAVNGIDVVINNAGFAFRSVVEHVEQDELLQQMITNFWGPMEIIRLALPRMRQKRNGRIINISSVGGMMAMPTMAVYSASKFALEGASESLYYEVKPWNISVTLVEPGFLRSVSFGKTRYTTLSGHAMRDPSEPYYGHYRFMTAFIEKLMRRSLTTPQSVARKIVRLIEMTSPPLRLPVTPDAIIFDLIRRLLPRRLYHFLLYRLLPYPDCWGDVDRLIARCSIERDKVKQNE